MFENQPKGLYALAIANTGERFGYYTMLAVFALFLRENFNLPPGTAGAIYSTFLALVYFLPLVGGALADKFGYGRMVTIGIIIMFFGYLLLSIPLGNQVIGYVGMFAALIFVSFGTGLFKGNLQVMVGNLYDAPELQSRRDSAFSIFYMAINVGALFAPTAAVGIMKWAQETYGITHAASYHFAFAVACASLVFSIAVYYCFRYTFRHVEGNKTKAAAAAERAGAVKDADKVDAKQAEAEKEDTHARVVALCLVFAVVLFFWMAFHQNGLTLTFFANEFTEKQCHGIWRMAFDVVNLVLLIFIIYALFSLFQSKTTRARVISALVIIVAAVGLVYKYHQLGAEPVEVSAPIFQQFNPCFVVALTPVSIALFGWLAKHGKEPSAPRKIAWGMLVAAVAYFIMAIGSVGLLTPNAQEAAEAAGVATERVGSYWLISTYLVLTFGELLLSPMGISFVSKVAPANLKGTMMGGWFVATAVGNLLVGVGGYLWGDISLPIVWGVFIAVCLIAAIFMFSIMKRLEKVC